MRGEHVNDDTLGYAVITEKGASAFHLTAAKVLDTISRSGEAADVVSAKTQVKSMIPPDCLSFRMDCPTVCVNFPRNHCPKYWDNIDDSMVPWERNLYGHPLAGPPRERQLEDIQLEETWENVPSWVCLYFHPQAQLFQSENVDDIKLAGSKASVAPIWLNKKINRNIDLEDPTSLIDQVY